MKKNNSDLKLVGAIIILVCLVAIYFTFQPVSEIHKGEKKKSYGVTKYC